MEWEDYRPTGNPAPIIFLKGSLGISEKLFYYRPDHSEIWYTYVKCHSEQLLIKEFFDFRPRKLFFDHFLKNMYDFWNNFTGVT